MHIRAVGHWTNKLYEHFEQQKDEYGQNQLDAVENGVAATDHAVSANGNEAT